MWIVTDFLQMTVFLEAKWYNTYINTRAVKEIKDMETNNDRKIEYKEASIVDLMEKYGIDEYNDISDIIVFSSAAHDYSDDYEEGEEILIQEMYDVPAIMCICINRALGNPFACVTEIEKQRFDNCYKKAIELSKQPCDNLWAKHEKKIIVLFDDTTDSVKIYVDDILVDELVNYMDCSDITAAIDKAI